MSLNMPRLQSRPSLVATWILGIPLAGVAGCSPAGFKEWATRVQENSAVRFAEQENQRQLSAWQAAGEGVSAPPPPTESATAETEAKPAETDPPPAAQPQYIFITPTP